MVPNALLLLTSSTKSLLSTPSLLKHSLLAASSKIMASGVLYVFHWCPAIPNTTSPTTPPNLEDVTKQIQRYTSLSSRIYVKAQKYSPKLDVRFLLHEVTGGNPSNNSPISLVLVQTNKHEPAPMSTAPAVVREFVNRNFNVVDGCEAIGVEFIQTDDDGEVVVGGDEDDDDDDDVIIPETIQFPRKYGKVALGGTFDRMHIAHKILITEAVARCGRELIVGVTVDEMNKHKLLYELIEPCETRVNRVNTFVTDIVGHSGVTTRVVPITDPYGPTILEQDIEFLVLSNESVQGGVRINEIRGSKGWGALDVYSIGLYQEGVKVEEVEEDKISSSSSRIRVLGDRVREPRMPPSIPYVIGLTGGMCSGKSTLCSYLETLGAEVINCDGLGHEAYKRGTTCFRKVVELFGEDVVSGDEINRKVLGGKVFKDPKELGKLNSVVWPEIRRLIVERIKRVRGDKRVVVLDAAILLEAGWDDVCHDVWVVVIPKETAIARIQARDGLSKEEAESRVASQVSNQERVKRATFVFCSLWEVDFTRRQGSKAWGQVLEVLGSVGGGGGGGAGPSSSS